MTELHDGADPAVQRVAHSPNPNYGTCTTPAGVSGVLHLIFSNEYSRWNSKTVKVKMGVRKHKGGEGEQATPEEHAQEAAAAASS